MRLVQIIALAVLALALLGLVAPSAIAADTSAGASPVVVQQSSSPASCCVEHWTTSVSCPAGHFALSGGGQVVDSRGPAYGYLTVNAPIASPPTGWTASADGDLSFTTTVTAYAVCR